MKNLGGLKAIFFDLDGTLTDISEREMHAIKDTASHFGVETPIADLRKIFDRCARKPHKQRLALFADILESLNLTFSDQMTEYLIASFLDRSDLTLARRGTGDTLKRLSTAYELLCVTSRETCEEVQGELKFLGLDEMFNGIVTRQVAADHLGLETLPFRPFKQQRTKLYECALDIVGLRPSEVLVVGDMVSELEPAIEMGMKTVGILSNRERKEDLREVSDHLISDMTELISILELEK